MAIAFLFESSQVGQNEYDGLMAALGRSDVSAPLPSGFIAHLAGPTQSGWRVIDVWEDESSAQAFYGSETFQSMISSAPPIDNQPWPLHRVEVVKTLASIG